MKKIFIVVMLLSLVGCSSLELDTNITDDKFVVDSNVPIFDIEAYIETIDPVITDEGYIRLDSVFLDDTMTSGIILTDTVMENLLQIYQEYERNHDTYALINFLDLHIKKATPVDIDILMFKIITRIEEDYYDYSGIVREDQFNYLIVDYISRVTDSFIESYIINGQVLDDYPDMDDYLLDLKRIVNGGYQIRRYNDAYYMFTDYASILTRYKDYYSDETKAAVDILVRESRNIVSINGNLQVDNEAIAYKVSEIENFMKYYNESVYYDMMRTYFYYYMSDIVTNPSNLETNDDVNFTYNSEAIDELNLIIDRYSDTQMSRILEELLFAVENNQGIYIQETVDPILERIDLSY